MAKKTRDNINRNYAIAAVFVLAALFVVNFVDSNNYNNTISLTGDVLADGRAIIYTGSTWTKATGSIGAGWSTRKGLSAVSFNNKIWVLGGSLKNDVWSSSDGSNWQEVTYTVARWSGRTNFGSVVFNNKLWVMGGIYDNYGSKKNDVWSSSDGSTWLQATASAPWSARSDHALVVFNGKMWILGGKTTTAKDDVWSSSDGSNWQEITSTGTKWSPRSGHAAVVFNNKMWVLGGLDVDNKNDVWSSSDGINWKQETNAPWSARSSFAAVVYDNKIWVIAGRGQAGKGDVWYSSDGATWTSVQSTIWTSFNDYNKVLYLSDFAGLVYDNKIWVIGGFQATDSWGGESNDVWYSTMGISTVSTIASATPTSVSGSKSLSCGKYGDVNADGKITSDDSKMALNIAGLIISPTPDQTDRADVSGDGAVSSIDALHIDRYLAGLSNTLPVCGSCQSLLNRINSKMLKQCGNSDYDAVADLNKDGAINGADASTMVPYNTNERWCYFKLQRTTDPCTIPTTAAGSCKTLISRVYIGFSSSCGTPGYIKAGDVNKDKVINSADFSAVNGHINDDSWCSEKLADTTDPCGTILPLPCGSYGDANGDGKISAADSAIVLNYVGGTVQLNPYQLSKLDVSGDGVVSSTDGLHIERYLAGASNTFPICGSCQSLLNRINSKMLKQCGNSDYDPVADLNKDGAINGQDASTLVPYNTDERWCYFKLQRTSDICQLSGGVSISSMSINCKKLLSKIYSSFGSSCGRTGYDTVADVDKSKSVAIADLSAASAHLTDDKWCAGKLAETVAPCTPPPPCGNYSDLNGDGKITPDDSKLALQGAVMLVALTPEQKAKADVSGDGYISSVDALHIERYVASLSNYVPVCGSCQDLAKRIGDKMLKKCGDSTYDAIADLDKDGIISAGDKTLLDSHSIDESWCSFELKRTTNPCAIPSTTPASCKTLLSKVYAAYTSSCGTLGYDKIADVDKSKFINVADFSTLNAHLNDGGAWCNQKLAEITDPCTGTLWSLATATAQWGARGYHSAVSFNGKMWVLGGYSNGQYKSDVWSSADGKVWTQAIANAQWSERLYTATVAFNDKLWILGGYGVGSGARADIWSSADGKTWAAATVTAAWGNRYQHAAVVFNNKIWVLGGRTTTAKNDVWSSSDGKNWQEITSAGTKWSARHLHSAVVFNGKMWVLGGFGADFKYKNDVWSSPDGVTWTQATASAPWSARYMQAAVVYDNKIWVIAGRDSGIKSDVWSSADGATWTKATENSLLARYSHAALVHDNKIWVLGGFTSKGASNNVWYSDWAVSAQGATPTVPTKTCSDTDGGKDYNVKGTINARDSEGPLFIPSDFCLDSIYLKEYFCTSTNDVGQENHPCSSCSNGACVSATTSWTQATGTAGAGWSARNGLSAVLLNGKIWVLGGLSGSNYKNDVWSSSDGINWQEVTSTGTKWSERGFHSAVSFNNKIWIMGGSGADYKNKNDVWSSSDGINWQEVTSTGTKWSARNGLSAIVFNNKIWIMGGYTSSTTNNDVWSSSDGINWQEVTSTGTKWSVRDNFATVVFNNKIWIMGGYGSSTIKNDVWSSSDGSVWTQVTANAPWSGRYGHAAVVYNNKIWIMGGFGADNNNKNDVWSSSDGINWNQEPNAPWLARNIFTATVFNNKIWIMGGTYANGNLNDVWSLQAQASTSSPTNLKADSCSQYGVKVGFTLPDAATGYIVDYTVTYNGAISTQGSQTINSLDAYNTRTFSTLSGFSSTTGRTVTWSMKALQNGNEIGQSVSGPTFTCPLPTTTSSSTSSSSTTSSSSSTTTTVPSTYTTSIIPTTSVLSNTEKNIVDSTGDVGRFSSIEIPFGGKPVITYYDYTNKDLKVAKCGNVVCSSGNTITSVDTNGRVGAYLSTAIDYSGLPVISYYDQDNGDLKVLKCGNAACSSGNIITTVDSTGNVGLYTSIDVAWDGKPIISYYDATNHDLKVLKCGNAACSSGNIITTVDSTGDVGTFTAIKDVYGSNSNPVIVYVEYIRNDYERLKVVKCGNAACSSGNTITTINNVAIGGFVYPSMNIGDYNGNPIIAYYDGNAGTVNVVKCTTPTCSTTEAPKAIDNVGKSMTASAYASINISYTNAYKPSISYYRIVDNNYMVVGHLKLAKCGDASCSSNNIISEIDTAGPTGQYSSLAPADDGSYAISYYDTLNADLKVAVVPANVAGTATPAMSTTSSASTTTTIDTGYQTT